MAIMKPLALDLCCGKGGWTIGLLKAGWDVIGVDIEDMGGYPSHLVFADVREIAKDVQAYFPALKFDLVVASPPCQEFSYSSFPFKVARERFKDKPPDRSIWDACVKIAKDLDAPLILENVGGARKYMGAAAWKYGSWYFWGVMPALYPPGNPRKGFHRAKGNSTSFEGVSNRRDNFHAQGERGRQVFGWNKNEDIQQKRREPFPGEKEREKSEPKANMSARKRWSATVAMIPEELSTWIGECFKPREAINQ